MYNEQETEKEWKKAKKELMVILISRIANEKFLSNFSIRSI